MKSLFEVIQSLPPSSIDHLYLWDGSSSPASASAPWACRAIFQSTSTLSKCIIMKLLFISESFSIQFLQHFIFSMHHDEFVQSIDELIKLSIIVEDNPKHEERNNKNSDSNHNNKSKVIDANSLLLNSNNKFHINPNFQSSLKYGLSHPSEPWWNDNNQTSTPNDNNINQKSKKIKININHNDSNLLTLQAIESYSRSKWNELLSLLINSNNNDNSSQKSALESFVIRSGLMTLTNTSGVTSSYRKSNSNLQLTAKGYEYLLKDHNSQVWEFVYESLVHSNNQFESLSLLFMLSFCQYGNYYPIERLTTTQKLLIQEFYQLGIIFMEENNPHYFYPTNIAINMIFGHLYHDKRSSTSINNINQSLNASNNNSNQFKIIVETNYQVIAYVTDELHFAMLKLFVDIQVRMPNMATGRITREKAKEAFQMGIKSHQIVEFLTSHAHEIVKKNRVNSSIVPDNVIDQLALWELERKRIVSQEAIIIDFRDMSGITKELFINLISYLNSLDLNIVIWSMTDKTLLAIAPEGIDYVQAFMDGKRFGK
eukprot:gene9707-13065_t